MIHLLRQVDIYIGILNCKLTSAQYYTKHHMQVHECARGCIRAVHSFELSYRCTTVCVSKLHSGFCTQKLIEVIPTNVD